MDTQSEQDEHTRELRNRRERDRDTGTEVLQLLKEQARTLGFSEYEPPAWDEAEFLLERDPSDGNLALIARWYHNRGQRLGEVTVREDGYCYGECDLLQPHPGDKRWFIEAVAVWGRSGALKGDPRLLPAL
jgi:hypothetical protein